jgi:uncharacterized protein YaiI (UPF0178 family)
MTESRTYITEDLRFPCDACGKQITHHTVHTCFVMNSDILPTQEEWQLVCKMVKQQRDLTDEEINQIVWQQNLLLGNDDLRKFARAILQKAKND